MEDGTVLSVGSPVGSLEGLGDGAGYEYIKR
jgi:hypothetical protein